MNSPLEPRFPERPLLSTIQPARPFDGPPTSFDDDGDDDNDIYRGEPEAPADINSISSSSSGSSSSSSERQGGPLGALAAIVEKAVSRWAKGARSGSPSSSTTSSSSSDTSSSSSSTSRSSIDTLSNTRRRPRRRSSQVSLQTIQSERDIIAHISRLKALEESRQIPRQFGLYLPPTLEVPGMAPIPTSGAEDNGKQRILSTTSLSLAIAHLAAVMKASRTRKPRGRSRDPDHLEDNRSPRSRQAQFKHDSMKARSLRFSSLAVPKKSRKGKRRAVPITRKHVPKNIPARNTELMPKAWFLDVASPSWEDLRTLGKLLHIHPLTLEDILQQDPREKLELFPKLGYYFISFRAMESQGERTKMQREARTHAEAIGDDPDAADIPIGEANVYLTVFNDGICCFHYRDITDHLDRVRNRIVLLDEVVNMSADWIAHGILDSIVDSFFPFLNEIEKEVMEIDDLVYADGEPTETPVEKQESTPELQTPSTIKVELEPEHTLTKEISAISDEKKLPSASNVSQESFQPHFSTPRPTVRMLLRRARRHISGLWSRVTRRTQRDGRTRISPRATTLRRMAKTRRLVTSLGRSLAGKSEVMTQIRKRLAQTGFEPTLGNGGSKSEELEVGIYMGDVHDHILTLQHSLNHIERMLSQSHPSYLSQLRTAVARTKGGSDKSLLYLTVISIAVLCCQAITGTFSMNVHVPANEFAVGHPYNVFGIAISLVCVVLTTYLTVVYHWWKSAKRKRGAMLRKDTYYIPATVDTRPSASTKP